MTGTFEVIGTATARTDGPEKVTGSSRFTADRLIPGMLWAKALRSTQAHARIRNIDISRASKLPGVRAILTGRDVHGVRLGRRLYDVPVIADDTVRFIGERVAAVAADSVEIAEQACQLIKVDYDVLAAVIGPEAALAPHAPVLHPHVNEYKGLPRPVVGNLNAFVRDTWFAGDTKKGFRVAELIIEGTYTTQRVHQAYMEPHSCVVWLDDDEKVHIYSPNKAPHRLKANLSEGLQIPLDSIVVHHSMVGGDFGGKGSPMDVPVCYFLAKRTGKPVRMAMTYTEELTAGNPRHASVSQLRTGVMRDGRLVAHQARILFDSGAYGGFKPVPGVNLPGASHAAGAYRIPNVSIEAIQVYTNAIPGGFYRGPGAVQSNFGIESHMDVIADALRLDPLELRIRNLIRSGDLTGIGHVAPMMKTQDTITAAVEAAGWYSPKPTNVGRGISLSYKGQGGGQSSAGVELRTDGSVVLHTTVFEQGTGSYTAFAQIVGEEMGLSPERVLVEPWDTDDGPFDTGIGASRVTRITAPAVYAATHAACTRLKNLIATSYGWPDTNIDIKGHYAVRTDTGERLRWADVLARAGTSITTSATNSEEEDSPVASFMAQIAEVAIDKETGKVDLLRVISAHDTGLVINPIGHQGQINGGIMQAIGHSLMEDLAVGSNGQGQASNMADYRIPTMADIPQLTTVLVESEDGTGPYRTKGIGEYSIEALAAAIANAVSDAAGVRITSLPISAEKLHELLQHQSLR